MPNHKKGILSLATRKRELERAIEEMKEVEATNPKLIKEYEKQLRQVAKEMKEERKATKKLNKLCFKKK